MNKQPRLAIRVVAAALALSACGVTADAAAGTPVAYASVVSARHAADTSRFADLRNLTRAKRDVAWAAIGSARARPTLADTSRFADLRSLAQVKRDAAWAAVERAWGG
jgi:hypothetical protein